jgi:hypothetical protein
LQVDPDVERERGAGAEGRAAAYPEGQRDLGVLEADDDGSERDGYVQPVVRPILGGLDVGATRAEVVSNTRGLIAVADAWTRKQGRGSDG